jgi:hypothetical protein
MPCDQSPPRLLRALADFAERQCGGIAHPGAPLQRADIFRRQRAQALAGSVLEDRNAPIPIPDAPV